MTKSKNPFQRITQYYVEDGGDIHWWIDDEDLEDFKKNWCHEDCTWEDMFKGETRELNGKQWNEWMVGQPYGDYEGVFVDEDCPTCGCFLIQPDGGIYDEFYNGTERHCSNHDCAYMNESFDITLSYVHQQRMKEKNAPPEPQFREPGQTVEEFADKYKIQLDRKDEKYLTCVKCKQVTSVSDFYRTKKYAIIIFGNGHKEDCDNKGCPTTLVPLGKEQEKWAKLF